MSAQFRTRKQLEEARKSGDIRGWFGKLPRGRPPKEIAVPAEAPVQSTVSESGRSDLSSETSSRGSKNCTSWNSDESFPFLRDAVVSSKAGLPAVGLVASVPRPTTIRMTSLFESAAEEYGVDIGSVTREMVYKQKRKSLLSLDEIAFLQNVIQYRDEFPPKTQRISMPLPPSCCRLLSTTLTTISFYYIISCIISCFYIFIWPTTSMDRECTVTNS